jgi:hypothetical protein
MYELLFRNTFEIFLILFLSVVWLAVFRKDFILVFIFDYGPNLAIATLMFFCLFSAFNDFGELHDTLLSVVFEVVFFGFYSYYFFSLRKIPLVGSYGSILTVIAILQLFILMASLNAEGFGIFSQTSRVSYLSEAWYLKYLTYINVILWPYLAKVVAELINSRSRFGFPVLLNIIILVVSSILSGSKAGFLFWFLMLFCFLDSKSIYRLARMPFVWLVISSIVALVYYVISSLSKVLDISFQESLDLVFSRLLLNNDARAIVLSVVSSDAGWFDFLTNSFRGYALKVGIPPSDVPMGNLLYSSYFGSGFDTNGANASFVSLVIYYLDVYEGWLVLWVVFVINLGLVLAFRALNRLKGLWGSERVLIACFGLVLVRLFSQDFLAFQLLLNLLVLYLIFIVCKLVVVNHARKS